MNNRSEQIKNKLISILDKYPIGNWKIDRTLIGPIKLTLEQFNLYVILYYYAADSKVFQLYINETLYEGLHDKDERILYNVFESALTEFSAKQKQIKNEELFNKLMSL